MSIVLRVTERDVAYQFLVGRGQNLDRSPMIIEIAKDHLGPMSRTALKSFQAR